MNKYIKSFSAIILGLSALTSCADKLDVTNPNYLTDDQIMDVLKNGSDTERTTIIGGLAANLNSYMVLRNTIMSGGFSNMSIDNEWVFAFQRNLQCGDMVYGDEKLSGSVAPAAFCYRNDPTYEYWDKDETSACYGYWASPAISINQANKVSQFLTDDVVSNSTLLKEYRGRALTIWSMGYLQLMERFTKSYLYGGKDSYGMPIYTRFAYQECVKPSTAVETWDLIKSNLRTADQMFQESGLGSEGFTVGTENATIYDLDRGIALYFLARADLQTGDYAECIKSCQTILDKYGWKFIAEKNYGCSTDRLDAICDETDDVYSDDNAFLSAAVNPEVMFGWCTDANIYPWFYLNVFYGSEVRISSTLHDQFDDRDFRKYRFTDHEVQYPFLNSNNVKEPSTIKKYENLKFCATIASDQTARSSKFQNSDVIYIRTSEVLLMLAEAQAMNGDESGAKATLNKLLAARTKAGETTMTCDNYKGMSGKKAIDMVKLQWRMEMWGEKDLLFYGYKRWNTEATRESSSNHWNTTSFTIDHMTWEIPQKEVSANPYWMDLIYK